MGLLYYQSKGRKTIRKTLSERAKEYLKEQNHAQFMIGDSIEEKDSAPKDAAVYGKKDKMNNCFNFTVPFTVNNKHHEGDCSEYFSITQPRGTIYANRYTVTSTSPDDLSDISMRRVYKDKYEESRLYGGGREFIIFRNKEEPYQKTAFYFSDGKVFIVTLTSDNTPEVEIKFKTILTSVELL